MSEKEYTCEGILDCLAAEHCYRPSTFHLTSKKVVTQGLYDLVLSCAWLVFGHALVT